MTADENINSIDAAVKDFVRFLPEEKQSDYEVMLKNCNFHDATDPGFPIMLFLLFFQESVSEKIDELERAVIALPESLRQDASTAPEASPPRKKPSSRTIAVVLFGGYHLLLSGGLLYLYLVPVRHKTAGQNPNGEARTELEALNRYWLAKLEQDEGTLRSSSPSWTQLVTVCSCCSLAIFLLGLAVIRLGRRQRRSAGESPRTRLPQDDRSSRRKVVNLFRNLLPLRRVPALKRQSSAPETGDPEK